MKKILLILTCIIFTNTFYAQSDQDIANVYIKRSQESLGDLRFDESLEYYQKAMKYMDTITKSDVAHLGMRIYFELNDYAGAQNYGKQYFALVKNKKTQEYLESLDLYVTITERLETEQEELRKLERERIEKEKELRRIDSLKTVWESKSNLLSIKADSIYKLNKSGSALYYVKGSYGIIDDSGNFIIEANEYKHGMAFDGFIVLTDNVLSPTKVYVYDTISKTGYLLPSVSDFNSLSTNYGYVMMPRANGRLVMYPNNSLKTLVYDLKEKKIVRVANEKELFKTLRKTDKIDKSNSDGQVKVDKEWYNFGGHLGGGIHPLYNNDYSLYGFLCSIDGTILKASEYSYLGANYNNKSQAIKGGKTFWVDQNGKEVSAPKDESGEYKGGSHIIRIENGNYQIIKDGIIILGDKRLEKMVDFLRGNSPE